MERKNLAVTSNINGDITVDGVFVGNFLRNPSLRHASEAELLEDMSVNTAYAQIVLPEEDWGQYDPITPGPDPIPGGPGSQDSGGGFAHDPWVPHDPDPDWHPEPHGTIGSPQYGQPGFYDIDDWYAQAAEHRPDYYNPFLNPGLDGDPSSPFEDVVNDITQPIVDTFPDWEGRGADSMGMSYRQDPSMCKLALMNKALIAIVQAGAVTSTGNPLLGVVGSILMNGLKRLGVGPDWGRRIFGDGPDIELCQRIVEEAIAVGYLRIPKPNADGSLPARMQVTLDPDSPRATLQWRRKTSASRPPARKAAVRRRTYRRRT